MNFGDFNMDFSDLAIESSPGLIGQKYKENKSKREMDERIKSLQEQAKTQRQADFAEGRARGEGIFNDAEMQGIKGKYAQQALGYGSAEGAALRSGARAEMAGERQSAVNKVQGAAAKQGVTGSRAAALQGAANDRFINQQAQAERKMAIDNANLQRQGTNDLASFIMRQKFGILGTELGYGQMGVADRTGAYQQAQAEKEPDRGIVGNILKPFFG